MQTWEEKILIKQEGIAEGRLEGKLEEKQELTRKLANKFSIEQIAEMLEIDISEVENIIKEITKWQGGIIYVADSIKYTGWSPLWYKNELWIEEKFIKYLSRNHILIFRFDEEEYIQRRMERKEYE